MTVQSVFDNITQDEISRYTEYWNSIAPQNDSEIFQRWLFAYMSIHTTWEGNVRGYQAIKNFEDWIFDKKILFEKLTNSRVGMQNKRTEYIWNFSRLFFLNPKNFHKKLDESWFEFRDRLVKLCGGIGLAKVSFTLEMCFPQESQVVCLDTHMIKLYGIELTSKKIDCPVYLSTEKDWLIRSISKNTSPCITRAIFWDKKQKQNDSRYWSYVLEA